MLSRLFPQKKSVLVQSRLVDVRLPTLDDFAYFESWYTNKFGSLDERLQEAETNEEKSLILKKAYDSARDGSSIDQDHDMMNYMFSSVDGLTIVLERLTSLSAIESRLIIVSLTEDELKKIVRCFFDNLTPNRISRMIDQHLGIPDSDFKQDQSESSLEDYALILASRGYTFDYIKTLTIPQVTELLTADQEDFGAYDRLPTSNYESNMKLRWKWHRKYARLLKEKDNGDQPISDVSHQRYGPATITTSDDRIKEFCNGSQPS